MVLSVNVELPGLKSELLIPKVAIFQSGLFRGALVYEQSHVGDALLKPERDTVQNARTNATASHV